MQKLVRRAASLGKGWRGTHARKDTVGTVAGSKAGLGGELSARGLSPHGHQKRKFSWDLGSEMWSDPYSFSEDR